MLPVFALVLDKDVRAEDLLRLPELYAELGRGRSLTLKTFFLWVLISVYQGINNYSNSTYKVTMPSLYIDLFYRGRSYVWCINFVSRWIYSHCINIFHVPNFNWTYYGGINDPNNAQVDDTFWNNIFSLVCPIPDRIPRFLWWVY